MVVLFFFNVNLGGVYFFLLCLFYFLFSTSFYKSKFLYLFIINIIFLNGFYILFNLELKNFIFYIIKVLVIILPLLISIAYFTLVERKVLGFMQRRRGPNVVGFFGLLQPIADGVKLIFKETIEPTHDNKVIFF
jgi:NADH:ubiquinone oxidoreductase subunit H